MARLNTHLSATPQLPRSTRSSTVDSLYRNPSLPPRASTYSVHTSTSQLSDKENEQPDSRESTPRPSASKARNRMAPGVSASTRSSVQPQSKRRRTGDYASSEICQSYHGNGGEVQIYEDDEEDAEEGSGEGADDGVNGQEEDDDVDEEQEVLLDDDDEDGTKYYDPEQPPEIRRIVRANIRNHHREIEDKRDELIRPDNHDLLDHIKKQNYYMTKVKQTADAALDARVLVYASDLASKRLKNTLHGQGSVGIDVDQFVSRCIHFMKSGGDPEAPSATQVRNRRRTGAEEEDEEDEDTGEALDWALMGKEACFPFNKRPPVSSFLLGPLSVQRRARASQVRRVRQQRQPVGPATKPQELTQADIKQSENSNLPHLVKGIKDRLEKHIEENGEKAAEELSQIEGDPDEEDIQAASRRHRVWMTTEGEGAVSLFDFVVNPTSFGQTVENLFYISFLIREGSVKVEEDDDGLPLLVPSQPHSLKETREQGVQKRQAVFSLDWPTWKKLIKAFDIKEPLIPHRVAEATTVSAGGWYG